MKKINLKIERENFLGYVAVLSYLIYIIMAIFFKRSYYADGTEFIRNIINQGGKEWIPIANDINVMRVGCNFVNQILIIVAVKIGITNIGVLQILFSIPLFFNEILGLFFCYELLDKGKKRYIIFPFANYVLFEMISEIFILNQAFTASWVYWILFFTIIKRECLCGKLKKCVLIISIFLLPFLHETTIVIFILIVPITLFEVLFFHNISNLKYKVAILVAFIFAFFFDLAYMKMHKTTTGGVYFTSLLSAITTNRIWFSNLIITVISCFLIIIFMHVHMPTINKYLFLVIGLLFVGIMFFKGNSNPILEYECRSIITLGTFGMILMNYLFIMFEKKISTWINFDNIKNILLITLLLQSAWQIGNNIEWNKYLKEFDKQLYENKGYVVDEVKNVYSWPWTSPGLSLLESPDRKNIDTLVLPVNDFSVVLDDNGLWIPFSYVNKNVFNYKKLKEKSYIRGITLEDIIEENVKFALEKDKGKITNKLIVSILMPGDWIYQNTENYRISYHIYDENGICVVFDTCRTDFVALFEGEKFIIDVKEINTLKSGRYKVVLDVVKEGEYWVSDYGEQFPTITFDVK